MHVLQVSGFLNNPSGAHSYPAPLHHFTFKFNFQAEQTWGLINAMLLPHLAWSSQWYIFEYPKASVDVILITWARFH